MSKTDHLASTIEPPRRRRQTGRFLAPSLTILYHPDPARVGEVAYLVELLHGREQPLSRIEPTFASPGLAAGGAPLGDRHLSRKPLRLTPVEGGVELTPTGGSSVLVGGVPVTTARAVSRSEIERGVVIELAERIVLFLHMLAPPQGRQPPLGMVGDSDELERVREEIVRVADLGVPVLIRGESGTGKELAARAIAQRGQRAGKAFVPVNMAAVPTSLAVSELFGHAAGAYTGAGRAYAGRFVQADGGTLFLDEVGQAPVDVQAMLLRALETQDIEPLGGSRAQRVDVRVIAATDEDLEKAISNGQFREALYHRLAGYQLQMPPLRARRDDVGRLFFHFLREELRSAGEEKRLDDFGSADPWLPAETVSRLARYEWPGNIRQLRNVVRHLVVAGRSGARAIIESLQPALFALQPAPVQTEAAGAKGGAVDELTEDALVAALEANLWHVAATARQLGISRTTLYARMEASTRLRKASQISEEEIRRCHGEQGGEPDAMAAAMRVSSQGLRRRLRELGID